MLKTYHILVLEWGSPQQSQLKAVREQVFIIEQGVSFDIEWDAHDANAIHLLAVDEAHCAMGCARILKQGYIGRMAVLSPWRRQGVGRALLDKALLVCQTLGMPKVAISAQTRAIEFYQQAGFVVISEAYIEANIWHVDMQKEI